MQRQTRGPAFWGAPTNYPGHGQLWR